MKNMSDPPKTHKFEKFRICQHQLFFYNAELGNIPYKGYNYLIPLEVPWFVHDSIPILVYDKRETYDEGKWIYKLYPAQRNGNCIWYLERIWLKNDNRTYFNKKTSILNYGEGKRIITEYKNQSLFKKIIEKIKYRKHYNFWSIY